LNKPL